MKIRLPDSIMVEAAALADADHIPLEEFVVQAVADWIAAAKGMAYLRQRGQRGDRDRFLAVLAKSPHVPPKPGDELP